MEVLGSGSGVWGPRLRRFGTGVQGLGLKLRLQDSSVLDISKIRVS